MKKIFGLFVFVMSFGLLCCKAPSASGSPSYTITYNANDGTVDPLTQTQVFSGGSEQSLKLITELGFAKEGYSFAGWALESNSTQALYSNGANFTATANLTLYALWSYMPVYNVRISNNIVNGSVSVVPATGSEGTEITINFNPDSGYNISTYSIKDSNSNEITVTDGKFLMPSSDVTIDASFAFNGFVTLSNIAEILSGFTQEETIIVTGEVTSADIAKIKNAINQCNYNINLDLTKVTGLTELPENSFYGCSNLKTISLPATVASIGETSFLNCYNLENIIVDPNNNKYESDEGVLFAKNKDTLVCCPKRKKGTYVIPEGVVNVVNNAFRGCSELTNVKIASSVKTLGISAFEQSGITEIAIPKTVESIGVNQFRECWNLNKVSLPDNITQIEYGMFYGCGQLENISIPDSVSYIGERAFYECRSLKEIIIPSGVSSINDYTFENCTSLTKVVIPDTVSRIGSSAFENTKLNKIDIPNSVTSIRDYAFRDCDSLETVTIPASVQSIGYLAFNNERSLKSITVDENNSYFSSSDGVLFDKKKEKLLVCPATKTGIYTIPETVIEIGAMAFANNVGLTEVKIPSSVKTLDACSFQQCKSLEKIEIPGSVTFMGAASFYECTSLKTLKLSNSITEIVYNTFYGCSALQTITIPSSVVKIGDWAFQNCENLSEVVFEDAAGWKTGNVELDLTDPSENGRYLSRTYSWNDWIKE